MIEAPDLLGQFSKSLIRKRVGIIEFAESDEYCGEHLFPRQRTLLKLLFLEDLDDYDMQVIQEWQAPGGEVHIAPKILERRDWLKKEGYPHFRIIQFVGGRRSSKGHVTGLALAYKLYQTQQLDNPGLHFGIPSGKDIYFSIVADSMEQAQAHQFGDAFNWIMACKPLVDQHLISKGIQTQVSVYTNSDLRRKMALAQKGTRIDKDMASLIVKAHGTNSKTIRGSATLAFAFDEMAHLIAGESRMSDSELWKAVLPSLQQFGKEALIFANSSPYTKTGQFYKLYEQIQELDPVTEEPNYPDHFMLQFPTWELYRDWDKDPYWSSNPLPEHARPPEDNPILASEERADPEVFKVEYRAQFAEVVDSFVKPEMVDRMFNPDWNKEILGYDLIPTTGAVAFSGTGNLERTTQYKGHGDPSSTHANFGIAVGHIEEILNSDTGIQEPHVVFDLIDAFYPADFVNETIDWLQVVPAITQLINNFRPYEWTFDQFESDMAIQQLRENLLHMGITETIVGEKTATADRNARRAKNFRAALNLGRVHAPHPSTFNTFARVNSIELAEFELKFLQEKPTGSGKIEKQSIGPVQTKDIADCMMEVVDALIGDNISSIFDSLNAGPVFGAPGGYGIGQSQPSPYGNTNNFDDYFGHWYTDVGRSSRGKAPNMPSRGRRYNRRYR